MTAATLLLAATAAWADGPAVSPPERTTRGFVYNWDANRDGQVSFHEIRRMAPVVFQRFDANRDGVLSGQEAAAFDAARRGDIRTVGGLYGSEVARMAAGFQIARNDIDGDGRISFGEFRLAATDWLGMLDRNGSGYLTDYDFTRAR